MKQAGADDETPLPFAGLARLHALLRADPRFAPLERAVQIRSFGNCAVAIAQDATRPPLWALAAALWLLQTGRAASRARVCQDVSISVLAAPLNYTQLSHHTPNPHCLLLPLSISN